MPYNTIFFEERNALTDLLVITDVPRLRKVFSRLADDHHFRLRVTSSLEKGGEEIIADKPAMVFVQTHLSGLSADILLLHLKKQLGRRRSRFVLLSPLDQVGVEVLKLYHGHIDSSLDDKSLAEAILGMISTLVTKKKKPTSAVSSTDNLPTPGQEPVVAGLPSSAEQNEADPLQPDLAELDAGARQAESAGDAPEPTLEEQGVVYAPRPPIPVYSEFTSTFDTAVNSMAVPEAPDESQSSQAMAGMYAQAESNRSVPPRSRSKLLSFLLWLVPVIVVVVVVTILQHRSIQPTSIEVAATPPALPAGKSPASVSMAPDQKKPAPAPVSPDRKPVARPSATVPDARMTDRAVLTTIAENRAVKASAPTAPQNNRPRELPVFIPRAGLDKAYSAANPGWERYKGVVTEFKVFREGELIKAIQVIDRGGQGVPDAFMKGALQQLAKNPSYVVAASEKKDGYEIQRGQVTDNLKVVYYRDAEGGRLRAFVLTWQ